MLSARGIMWVTGKGNGAAHGGGSGGGSSLTVEMIAVSMKVSGTTARRQEGGVTLVEGWKRKTVSVSTVGWKQTVGWKRGESSGGCGGGRGEATMDAGVKSDEEVTNFCPGRRAK